MTRHPVTLSTRGVHKAFGRTRVLHDVDLTLPGGRITAVLGPNGSGKTTLNKIMLGLVRPDRGAVLFNGVNVTGTDAYRAAIGYMPQAPRFPEHLSARHVLSLVQSLRASSHAVNVDAVIDAFDLRGYLDRALGVCSGGQRQRVNAAVAFLFKPDVLVLDEPTAGLDPVASASLKDRILRERDRGCAVLITSHVLSELEELADDVVFLLEGRIRYAGSLDALRTTYGGTTLERAISAMMLEAQQRDASGVTESADNMTRATVGGAA